MLTLLWCVNVGIRDWTPVPVTDTFQETLPADATRYVSEGSGTVTCGGTEYSLAAGTLVTVVSAEVDVTWKKADGCDELLLLTAEYWKAERIAARRAAPLLAGVLGVLAVGVVLVEGLLGS